MPKQRSYTDTELTEAVRTNYSMRAVLHAIGLVPAGGNYKHTKAQIDRLELDTSHWTGQGHLKGKKNPWIKKRPLDEILVENSTYTHTHRLKQRLIEEKYFNHKCYKCNRVEWNNKPIPLELEHINGINNDHKIENLTLLCPNCHAQTPTYRGRNKRGSTPTG